MRNVMCKHMCTHGPSVRAALEAPGGRVAEVAAHRPPRCDGAFDVVLRPPQRELAVVGAHSPCRAHVPVERHADAPGVDQIRPPRPRTAKLEVAVAEDDRPIVLVADTLLVLRLGVASKAVIVTADASVHVEDP